MSLLQRRTPTDIRQELNRIYEGDDFSFMSLPSLLENFMRPAWDTVSTGDWMPAIELKEMPNEYIVKAEVPGIDKANLDIEVNERRVILKGETRRETDTKDGNVYRSELRYGKLYRQIALPGNTIPQKATATFKDGIVTILLPKSEGTKEQTVKLTVK